MAQKVVSVTILAGHKKLLFEKPRSLHRIFVSITVLAGDIVWRQSRISFDDPTFASYYILDGQFKRFEIKCAEMSQGDIWIRNSSGIALDYTATEILA